MSQETMEWLNTQTLIGFTEKRGNAWHYQESLQGDEPNHYPGAIPVPDVERRLFNWEAVSEPVYLKRGDHFVAVEGRQAISADDDIAAGIANPFEFFKAGYKPHQYREWLVQNVSAILDDDLGIGSAGLLKNGAQAWVSVEVPENITTPEGVEFRPNLVAATSFDGSLSTTYTRTVTAVVCDNTLQAGLAEDGQKYRLKHTKYSTLKIADAREALAIVYGIADDFAAEVARLCSTEVSDKVWGKVLAKAVPVPETEGRGRTLAENKRAKLQNLYLHDNRVAPWSGTAFGVLQAFNTYEHHFASHRGQSLVQRNRSAALTGTIANKDAEVLNMVEELVAA